MLVLVLVLLVLVLVLLVLVLVLRLLDMSGPGMQHRVASSSRHQRVLRVNGVLLLLLLLLRWRCLRCGCGRFKPLLLATELLPHAEPRPAWLLLLRRAATPRSSRGSPPSVGRRRGVVRRACTAGRLFINRNHVHV